MDNFTFFEITDKQRRIRIMHTHVSYYIASACISITITTEVGTGIVRTDISTKYTAAFRTLRSLFRYFERTPYSSFKGLLRHAAVTVHAVRSKIIALSASLYSNAITLSYLSKSLSDRNAFALSYGSYL